MSQVRIPSNPLVFVLCVLVALDIALRLWSGAPVEATRISGRETDQAFESLSGANQSLAAANQRLAGSVDRLASELRAVEKWADSQKALVKAEEGLAKSSETLANSLSLAADALKAMEKVSPKPGEAGEKPVEEEAPPKAN